jgi:hypothetical protein
LKPNLTGQSLVQRLFKWVGQSSRSSEQDEAIDRLSRMVASPLPRRTVIKLIAAAVPGLAVMSFNRRSVQAQSEACCNGTVFETSDECCTAQGIQDKYPITNLEALPNRVPHPGYEPLANGCGPENGIKVPDKFGRAKFVDCCNPHDRCYGTCNSPTRLDCDITFGICLSEICLISFTGFPLGDSRLYAACLKAGVENLGEAEPLANGQFR